MDKIKNFFKLEENKTKFSREVLAGVTTFFAMAYIIFVNPDILSQDGALIPYGAVFLATIFATVIGTLVMGLFANVPYAQAPGMGLNAFFTYTVCFGFGFTWQAALAMVFICGIINILITVTKIRKSIIKAIPRNLQFAIGGGIGIFIAYIGLLNIGWVGFGAGVPAITDFSTPTAILALVGLITIFVLLLLKVKGAILIGIAFTTVVSILYALISGNTTVVNLSNVNINFGTIGAYFGDLGDVFGSAFTVGFKDLFGDTSKLPVALLAIFSFSLSDTFDTIGTFIGTGRKTGIFSDEDEKSLETGKGFSSKMDKALFADSIATSIGAVLGTSNTTTYVESAAGIQAGGKTGLTSVTVAICFLLCILLAPIAGIVPAAATSPALIVVGIMMLSSFREIDWTNLEEAIPAFFAGILMSLCYNISMGIAFGFIFYIIVKLCTKKAKEVHPILWTVSGLFIIYFIFNALLGAGII